MTTPNTRQYVAHYLQGLRVGAPREYEAFVEAFDAWATEVTVAVTTAPQDQVLQQQGRAQAYLHLLQLFRNPTAAPATQSPSA